MTELRLGLSLEAIRAIAEGNELVFDINEDGIRVFLSCDDEALKAFKQQTEMVLLLLLPVGPQMH